MMNSRCNVYAMQMQ